MLCAICIGVLETRANLIGLSRNDDDPEMDFIMANCGQHRTIATLVASAAEGCLICKVFWDLLSDTERLSLYSEESTIATRPCTTDIEDGLPGWLTTLTWSPERYTGGSYNLISKFASSHSNNIAGSEGFDWRQNHYAVYILQPVASACFSFLAILHHE